MPYWGLYHQEPGAKGCTCCLHTFLRRAARIRRRP
uniref:Uncharacterized protein n=1 Tax=Myoviridae sp. ctPkm1 TaxID=2825099 RepID=A0A8S5TYD1_9CAUD|nr:MAG TPA: hypothetical protein [Myoviridae sp. ctPkm1]